MDRGDSTRDLSDVIPSNPSWHSGADFDDDAAAPFHMDESGLDDMDGYRGSSKPRGGKSGRRGGRVAGGKEGRLVSISKALSKILRHNAAKEGLKLDEEGYAKVDELLLKRQFKSLNATFPEILETVADNSKQRFSLKPNPTIIPAPTEKDLDPSHWLIRANQGHTIVLESSALLKPVTLDEDNIPDVVVHGTYFAYLPLIVSSGGLKNMGRNHVHCSTGLPEDRGGVVSGMRTDAEVLIYIDVKKSLQDKSLLWWISDNGVILTEGDEAGLVPTKYFKRVEGRKENVGLLWEDGKEVAQIPEGVKGRKPPLAKTRSQKQINVNGAHNFKTEAERASEIKRTKNKATNERRKAREGQASKDALDDE